MKDNNDPDDNVIRVAFGQSATASDSQKNPSANAELSEENKEKLETFSHLIDQGKVMVTLDTRVEGVRVPAANHGDLQLALNFSYRFQIPDFAFDEQGVRASLSFAGVPFLCDVPWDAVFLIRSDVTEENAVFEHSIPAELTHHDAELTVVLKTYVPKTPNTTPLKAKLNTLLPLLKAPAGLAGVHTLTDDDEGQVVVMMIWLSDATAAAGQNALDMLETESDVMALLSGPPTTRVLRDS